MQFLFSKKLLQIGKVYGRLIAGTLPDIQSDYDIAVLAVLFTSGDKLKQSELADILQVDQSRIAIMTYSLTQRGYISVLRSNEEGMDSYFFLTDKGRSLVPVVQRAIRAINHSLALKRGDFSIISFYFLLLQRESDLGNKGMSPSGFVN